MLKVFRLLKFLALEIGLFVFDIGSDLFTCIRYGFEDQPDSPYFAVATALCILLPATPEFFQFFELKMMKYREEPDRQFICLLLLVFWIVFSPFLLLWFTICNNYKVKI